MAAKPHREHDSCRAEHSKTECCLSAVLKYHSLDYIPMAVIRYCVAEQQRWINVPNISFFCWIPNAAFLFAHLSHLVSPTLFLYCCAILRGLFLFFLHHNHSSAHSEELCCCDRPMFRLDGIANALNQPNEDNNEHSFYYSFAQLSINR